MKQIVHVRTIAPIIAVFFSAAPLWAETAVREDNSNLFVWIFLAFCALIVVAQLIPAILMLLGFAKGVKKETVQPVSGPADQP
ncbi:MAG: hypothetical protein ACYDAA_10890 [Syntrophales bacterium]